MQAENSRRKRIVNGRSQSENMSWRNVSFAQKKFPTFELRKEVYRYIGEWFCDQEVYDYLWERIPLLKEPSIRPLARAYKLKLASSTIFYLRTMIDAHTADKSLLLVSDYLKAEYPSETARINAWIKAVKSMDDGAKRESLRQSLFCKNSLVDYVYTFQKRRNIFIEDNRASGRQKTDECDVARIKNTSLPPHLGSFGAGFHSMETLRR